MRIAVCLKHVPDPATVEVDPLTGAIDESRLLYITNAADESALEMALRLRSETDTVSAFTVGPARTDAVLRTALAAGADATLRLWDEARTATEPSITATLLAAALRADSLPDLVLCGARSADRGSGLVPTLIGEFLGWPVVTDVTHFAVHGSSVRAQRRLDRGAREEVEVTLPVVLALESGIARLRHASLPRLIMAQRATIPVRHPADLGLSAANLRHPAPVVQATRPPVPRPRTIFMPDSTHLPHERIDEILSAGVTTKSGQLLDGPPDQMAAAILAFLREHGFLEERTAQAEVPALVSLEHG